MRSLKKLNAAAGTSYTRWTQVVAALRKSKHQDKVVEARRVRERVAAK